MSTTIGEYKDCEDPDCECIGLVYTQTGWAHLRNEIVAGDRIIYKKAKPKQEAKLSGVIQGGEIVTICDLPDCKCLGVVNSWNGPVHIMEVIRPDDKRPMQGAHPTHVIYDEIQEWRF